MKIIEVANVSAREYYDMLMKHDWYYNFSDEGSVFRDGRQDENALKRMAGERQELQDLYDAFENHFFSGEAFGKEIVPLPKRPE